MKITVLTPSFNQGKYLEKNIHSVLAQRGVDVEHVVVDGGSTDSTVGILKSYSHLKWVSEKDNGQADALRKGLAMAAGEIIGWINSDDYYEDNILEEVLVHFQDQKVMWVVGNIKFQYDMTNQTVYDVSQEITFDSLVRNPDILRQQATFFRKSFLEQVGGWNPKYHMTMDYDLWIRMAKVVAPKMVDKCWACFRIHDDQKTSHRNIIRQANEIAEILRREGVDGKYINRIVVKKRWYWIKGFLKSIAIRFGLIDAKYANRPVRISGSGK